jgi:ABC-2 type transport system ATP-binding protein
MIEVEGLSKHFDVGNPLRRLLGRPGPCVEVLRGVDLSVRRGDFLALLGANGAGKTTVLKTIATLLLPDAGRVRVCGHDVTTHGRQVREAVGYVLADERSFHWRLSGRENLEFFAALHGIPAAAARARIRTLLDRLDLGAVAARGFGEYSTGMKQRLAIARALLGRPRVLVMDEPTRSVDTAHATAVWRLVREEVEEAEGCVVLVTHHIQEALALCGRVAVLSGGVIALDTSADRLQAVTAGLDGFTLAVRGLRPPDLPALRHFPGVRDIRIASQVAGEQTLEVWTTNGDLPLAGFIGELTGRGATVCSLQRSTPLQAVIERLTAAAATPDGSGVNGVHHAPDAQGVTG